MVFLVWIPVTRYCEELGLRLKKGQVIHQGEGLSIFRCYDPTNPRVLLFNGGGSCGVDHCKIEVKVKMFREEKPTPY